MGLFSVKLGILSKWPLHKYATYFNIVNVLNEAMYLIAKACVWI